MNEPAKKLECPACVRALAVDVETHDAETPIVCPCGATLWLVFDCAMTEDGWGPLFYYLSESDDD